jgi:hypothetical protein
MRSTGIQADQTETHVLVTLGVILIDLLTSKHHGRRSSALFQLGT